jgi:hypothetical protein
MGYGYVKNGGGKITTEWLQEGTYEIGKNTRIRLLQLDYQKFNLDIKTSEFDANFKNSAGKLHKNSRKKDYYQRKVHKKFSFCMHNFSASNICWVKIFAIS